MEKLKFLLFSVVTLGVVGVLGYWAVVSIQMGDEFVADKKIQNLQKENESLKMEIEKLQAAVATLTPKEEAPAEPIANDDATPAVSKYQSLIAELEKLVTSKVYLKLKSRGPAVATIQKFLNIYNNTSNKVDNDYGASTKTAVAAFQKDMGLTADGEAGPGTFTKMVEWLKKQG